MAFQPKDDTLVVTGFLQFFTPGFGINKATGNRIFLTESGSVDIAWTPGGQFFGVTRDLQWSDSANALGGTVQLALSRDNDDLTIGALAIRSGTTVQALRIYRTFTDASNYERMEIGFNTGRFQLEAAHAGTGSLQGIRIVANDIIFQTNTVQRWQIDVGGAFRALQDNSLDIGQLAGFRPRSIHVGTDLAIGLVTPTGKLTFGSAQDVQLHRDAADTLAQRRGTNEQTWLLYKTFTDASNYERLSIYGGGPNPLFNIEPESAGTGGANIDMHLTSLGFNSRVELHQGTVPNILSWGENVLELLPSGQSLFRGASSVRTNLTTAAGNARTTMGLHAQALSGPLTSGSTFTFTNIIPARAFLIGVSIRVDTTITGPTTIDIGDGVDVDRWGAGINIVAPTLTDIGNFTSTVVEVFPDAADVVITANGGDFTAGEIRCTVHYMTITPATT